MLPPILLLPPPAPAANFNERLGEGSCDRAAAQDFVSLKINRLEDTWASKQTVGAGRGCRHVSPAAPGDSARCPASRLRQGCSWPREPLN